MSVRKRGSRFYYDFMINRVRYRSVVPEARTRKQAEQVETQKRVEVFEGRYGKPTGLGIFEEFVRETYLPWSKQHKKSYYHDERYAEIICEFFKGKTFREISPLTIEHFKRQRREGITQRGEQRNMGTVNRELAQLSSIFSLAVDYDYCELNPCRKVKLFTVHSRRERVLTPDEETRLLEAMTGRLERYRPIVILALHTGMRRGEIMRLRWQDVDFSRNEIRIPVGSTKSGKGRVLPINAVLRTMLIEMQSKGNSGGRVFSGIGYTAGEVSKRISKVCDEIGLDDVTLHTCRHTFATRLKDQNVNPFTIRDLMGHATLRMTNDYTHTTPEMLQRAVELLEKRPDCSNLVSMAKLQVASL